MKINKTKKLCVALAGFGLLSYNLADIQAEEKSSADSCQEVSTTSKKALAEIEEQEKLNAVVKELAANNPDCLCPILEEAAAANPDDYTVVNELIYSLLSADPARIDDIKLCKTFIESAGMSQHTADSFLGFYKTGTVAAGSVGTIGPSGGSSNSSSSSSDQENVALIEIDIDGDNNSSSSNSGSSSSNSSSSSSNSGSSSSNSGSSSSGNSGSSSSGNTSGSSSASFGPLGPKPSAASPESWSGLSSTLSVDSFNTLRNLGISPEMIVTAYHNNNLADGVNAAKAGKSTPYVRAVMGFDQNGGLGVFSPQEVAILRAIGYGTSSIAYASANGKAADVRTLLSASNTDLSTHFETVYGDTDTTTTTTTTTDTDTDTDTTSTSTN